MGRLPFIAGNWKMNKTIEEALDLVRQLKTSISKTEGVEVAVAPPFTALYAVHKELENTSIRLAAQNLFWEEKGAFTGEVSPLMLKEVGCHYVILGHSERRQFFGETDEAVNRKVKTALGQDLKVIFCIGETLKEREEGKTFSVIERRQFFGETDEAVNRKVKTALGQDLKVIFCIGETLKEREEGKTFSVIERQVAGGLKDVGSKEMKSIVLAYEPIWAIGTGKTATPQQAEEVHRFIRERLERLFSREIAEGVRIQYGGSVTPENIKGLMSQENIDGALVGGASLKSDTFSKIVRFNEM
jgi:triosephosphate isomerase